MVELGLQTPGVYIRELEPVQPREVRLGITGFVGAADRGPLNSPQTLTGWGQFLDIFGGFTGYSYLAYSVFGFFLNGGERCHVVRVAHESATRASLTLKDQEGRNAIAVAAIAEGIWGRRVLINVEPLGANPIVLTRLAAPVAANSTTAAFLSVAGMARQDVVSLIDPTDPFQRDDLVPISSIDFVNRIVTFARPLNQSFAAGTPISGRGFRIVARLVSGPDTIREEIYDDLSADPAHERYFSRVINGQLAEPEFTKRIQDGTSILIQSADLSTAGAVPMARPSRNADTPLQGGDDGPLQLGARYYSGRENGAYFRPVPADPISRSGFQDRLFGLAGFEAVNEIGAVSIPDLILPDLYASPQVLPPATGILFADVPAATISFNQLRAGQRDMLSHCQLMGDRFAILDSPRGATIAGGTVPIENWPAGFQASSVGKHGALYYPWLQENPADFNGSTFLIPPSGHVAGVFAKVEREQGVGKAPANELLLGVIGFEFNIDDAAQSVLNPKRVNCLRIFPGRGPRIWGARTLTSDPEWLYVNVRRAFLSIVKQIALNLQDTVFEPADNKLREKITNNLTLFLRALFQDGTLAGATPAEAFFVKCDNETNPPEVTDAGEVVVLVGFAPAFPAEFVLVTVTRSANTIAVREQNS